MHWWDYLMLYPVESTMVIGGAIACYFGYIELSKFWNKPLFITKFGEWRVLRYVGRVVDMPNKRIFRKDIKGEKYICWVKIKGQPKRKIILESDDILETKPNRIVMDKKYMYWNTEDSAYLLSDVKPKTYRIDTLNMDRYMMKKIDKIDVKTTRSARASPVVVHNSLMEQHLSLESGVYKEEEEDAFDKSSKYIFDRESVGGYGTWQDLMEKQKKEEEEEEEKKKMEDSDV